MAQRYVVAVTGGAGFVGSNLCAALVEEGHCVFCIDNFYTGRAANVLHLKRSGRFTVVNHDITDHLPAALPQFDQIYNLACPASPPHYQADPIKTAMTCTQGVMHVLERARRDGARLLHASTSEVYGDPEVHPQSEDYFGNVNPIGPRSCYDEGKRMAETLITDFSKSTGLDSKIVRIFNTYGPNMQPDDGRVISNFIIDALKGEHLTIYGDGSQTRSFCYVDDLVEGLLKLMRSGAEVAGPVNLGNPQEITVATLAQIVIGLTNSPSGVINYPRPVDDPRRRRPDITKAQRHLDWEPKIPLEDGLARTIKYFSQQLGSAGVRIICDGGASQRVKGIGRSLGALAIP